MELDFGVNRFNSFFVLSPEMMALVSHEGRFLEVNPAWEKCLGFGPRELKEIPFLELLDPNDLSHAQLKIQKLIQGEKTVSFESRCRRKGQSFIWVEWTWNRPDSGEVLYLIGRDVTELKEAREELKESREKFKRLSESAKEGIGIHEKGIFIEANQALATLLGYHHPEELIGLDGLNFTTPEFRPLVQDHIARAYDQPYEIVMQRKDGSRFDCQVWGKPIRYQGRTMQVTTFLDITKMKEREKELFESQELFRKLAEASKDGIAVSEKGKILMANPALARMLGTSLSEVVGRNAVEFTAPEFRETLLKKVSDEVETPYEVMALRKDGTRFPMEITPRMTSYQGRRVRAAFFRDISQRRQIEEEIRREKEFTQCLLNSSVDGLLAFDQECRYTLWNPTMERFSGRSREEVLGRCAFDVFPFLKQTGEDHYFYEALAGKSGSTPERAYHNPAGQKFFFEARYMPVKNIRGEVIGGLGVVHDTTERKKAEEALRLSELNLKAVFNNTFQNIVLLDLSGKIRAFNSNAAVAFKENSGRNLENGRPLTDYIQPAHHAMVAKLLAKARKGRVTQIERPYLMGDGQEHWFEVKYHPVFGEKGEIEGICLTSLDIDDRKKAEEALRKSEADLRAVFNSSVRGFVLAGHDGRIRDFNQLARKEFRRARGLELEAGRFLADYVEPEQRGAFRERFQRVLKGEVLHLERPVQSPNGQEEWFEFIYNPVSDIDGRVMGVCLAVGSIDERKKAAEALRESEEKFRKVFEEASIGISLVDKEFRFLHVNQAFCQMLGYTQEEMRSRTFREITHPDDLDQSIQNLAELGKTGRFQSQKRYLHKNGNVVWANLRVTGFFGPQGDLVYTMGMIENITERKAAEEALRESEEKFRKVFEEAAIGMTLVGPDLKFANVNRAFGAMLGFEVRELVGKSFREITHPDDLFSDLLYPLGDSSGQSWFQRQKRYLHKDGRVVWGNFSVTSFLDEKGSLLYRLGMVEDITEQKKAEEALRQSEADLKAVFNSGSQVTILLRRDGLIQGFNKSAEVTAQRIMGIKLEKGMPFLKTLPTGANPEMYRQSFQAALEGRETQGERAIRSVDGTERWVEVKYQPVKNDEGGVDGVCFSLAFIDDRKRVEENLRESQERFERLAQVTKEGILIHENARIMDVNSFLTSMMGYAPEEMIGKSGFDFLAPESRETARQHMAQSSSRPYEVLALRKDGSTFPAELQGSNYQYKGRDLRVISVRDITGRKEAERTLRESEERYRRLVEVTPMALLVYREGKIVYLNPEGLKLLGAKSLREIAGKPILDIIHPDYREVVTARISHAIEKGVVNEPMEQKLIRLDGRVIDVQVNGIPFIYEGVAGRLALIQDITESKKIREMLLRYERLAAIGQVIAAIAHEIRNPLAVVSGMTQLLKAKLEKQSFYSQEMDTILEQSNRLKLFMDDILDFSREMKIQAAEIQAGPFLEKALALAQAQAEPSHKGVVVHWKIGEGLPPLWGDPERLEQVMVNLITNAYQAMEGRGTLTLSAQAEGGWMKLGVEDDGPGIQESDVPKLFEPFFTTKTHGSGLGLSISQKIMDAHEGHIQVVRIHPHGTLFTLWLPLQKADGPA